MPDLQGNLRAFAGRMHKTHNAFESQHLRFIPQARAAGRDAAFGVGRGHLDEDHGRTTECARAQVHQMKVLGDTVNGAVGGHR